MMQCRKTLMFEISKSCDQKKFAFHPQGYFGNNVKFQILEISDLKISKKSAHVSQDSQSVLIVNFTLSPLPFR